MTTKQVAESLELSRDRGQAIIDELITLGVTAEHLANQQVESATGAVEFTILKRTDE